MQAREAAAAAALAAASSVNGPWGGKPEKDVNVLCLGASAGTGHLRAAQAVALELQRQFPLANIRNEDIVEHISAAHRAAYHKGWETLLKVAPRVVGWTYEALEAPRPGADHPYHETTKSSADTESKFMQMLSEVSYLGNRAAYAPFIKLLKDTKWDLIVNCHMLGADIVGHYKLKRVITAPQVLVITDFAVHAWWLTSPVVDHYFVANQDCQAYLQASGVSKRKVSVSGIPIHNNFASTKALAREACAKHLGLNDQAVKKPVVLLMAGGLGLMMDDSFRAILRCRTPMELVAMCGKSAETKKSLEAIVSSTPTDHTVHIVGYTNEMDQYMRAADLLVGKPGGLASSEALALGLPMVCNMPLPGQEERNGDWLAENGTAVKCVMAPMLPFKVDQILSDKKRLGRMKRACEREGLPGAAKHVVDRSLQLIEEIRLGWLHETPARKHKPMPHGSNALGDIRRLQTTEINIAAGVLSEGLLQDPRSVYLESNESKRRYLSSEWVWPDIVSKVSTHGQVWVMEQVTGASHNGITGVALWEPPRSALASSSRILLSLSTIAASPLVAGITATYRLSQVRKLIESAHAEIMGAYGTVAYQPHWYLIAQAAWALPLGKSDIPDAEVGLPAAAAGTLDDVDRDAEHYAQVMSSMERDMLSELCDRADADQYPIYAEIFDRVERLKLMQSFGFIVKKEYSSPLPMLALVRAPK